MLSLLHWLMGGFSVVMYSGTLRAQSGKALRKNYY